MFGTALQTATFAAVAMTRRTADADTRFVPPNTIDLDNLASCDHYLLHWPR